MALVNVRYGNDNASVTLSTCHRINFDDNSKDALKINSVFNKLKSFDTQSLIIIS